MADPVPIDLGNDPLERLKNFLLLIVEAILTIFPKAIVIFFTIFLAILAFLVFFSNLFFHTTIP